MRGRRVILVFLTFFLAATSALAQEFWDKKDYTQWSKQDCKRMLENSPWAGRHDIVVALSSAQGYSASGGESSEQTSYIFHLVSALPIRQAMVRQTMIERKYDKMSAADKKTFDENTEKFLGAEFPDNVVVRVVFVSNIPNTQRTLMQFWQQQTLESVKDSTFLIGPNKQKIPPLSFSVAHGGNEFQFIFPRKVNGEPIIGPSDKTVGFEMNIRPGLSQYTMATTNAADPGNRSRGGTSALPSGGGDRERILMEFKVSKMMYHGQLVF